ncbi:MAG: radical SAM protein [Chloroflexi bacterium]|nr:radical SAM protein [Chloroflexota bacterium]
MHISISYPPVITEKGTPLLSQNRQFQWYHKPTYIYPVVPAYAATILDRAGYHVSWDDGIAEGLSPEQYYTRMAASRPDVILIETKTPVVKAHWGIISELKKRLPDTRIALVGDHVTALPEESLENSLADYVLTGGDYDFLLLNLCNHLSRGEELEPGVWFRHNGKSGNTGQFRLDHDLNTLPFIDRELTHWRLYSRENGNFKKTPGTYVMAGRDCWWHRCSFCGWTVLYPEYRRRNPESVLDEIGNIIETCGVREIFDDTGTFPVGSWLEDFCYGMIDRGYHRRVRLGCNLRFGAVTAEQYRLMRKAGFRLLLFGMESANQSTLDRLNKGIKIADIIEGCRMARQAGLEPHLTAMIGYPWETAEEAQRTIDMAKDLFRQGHATTLQATIVVPYPGTPLHEECRRDGCLLSDNWDEYDMQKPVMKTPAGVSARKLTQDMYRVFFTPRYVISRLLGVRNINDVRFIWRGFWKVLGHLKDFTP